MNKAGVENTICFSSGAFGYYNALYDKKFVVSNLYRFVTRAEWLAQSPVELTPQKTPVGTVVIAHTATDTCASKLKCMHVVKSIQEFHIDSRQWEDIAYNFLVSDDGMIYVGRGWDKYGSHTYGYNIGSICIAFIGTFTHLVPTNDQVNAVKILIEIGVKIGKITEDYKLYGHRQLISIESPGAGVYNIITSWSHWQRRVVKNH